MTDAGRVRILKGLLRFGGVLTGSAFLAVLLPADTMAAIHRELGLGELPRAPVVDYLARSVAAFYGFHGVLLFVVASDPVRFRPFVTYASVFSIVFGAMLVAIDLHAGMPPWWTSFEGPPVIVIGITLAVLNRRPRVTRAAAPLMMVLAVFLAGVPAAGIAAQHRSPGNPILPGWYADPEVHVFAGRYWIYPTYSAPYDEQTFMDAFSSADLVTWTKHSRILDTSRVKWATRAMWAPSIVEKDGWYYLFFGANDIQKDGQPGGIGVARSRRPDGPFEDHLGRPLIDRFHNGAQPIDQFVFKDRDGAWYIVYGGWRHCNIARLTDDFTGFVPFPDGTIFREITPEGYVEGAFMLMKDGKYYFMWSEGGWTGPNYAVAYAIGTSPFGPFTRVGRILQQDPSVATGAGHHSVLQSPSGKWYIVYHRRPLGEKDRNHRVVCIDDLRFDAAGTILPVVITQTGVAADPIVSR